MRKCMLSKIISIQKECNKIEFQKVITHDHFHMWSVFDGERDRQPDMPDFRQIDEDACQYPHFPSFSVLFLPPD